MAKIGLAQWELDQLVRDLKAGVSWDELKRTRLACLAPGVLEKSDYMKYAHKQAGIPLPGEGARGSGASASANPGGDAGHLEEDSAASKPQGRGKAK